MGILSLGFRVEGLGFRGLGLTVAGLGFRVEGLGLRASKAVARKIVLNPIPFN